MINNARLIPRLHEEVYMKHTVSIHEAHLEQT